MRDRAGRAVFGAIPPHSGEIGTQALQGAAGRVQAVVVYKVDRLTRALSDFAKIIDAFDEHGVPFVSVTQPFNPRQDRGVGAK